MTETLSISLSSPAFSFLLYENIKNKYIQEGFLLGEIVEKETRTITDNDQRQLHVSRVIKINSVVPCPKTCHFYDGIGKVDVKKIQTFLGDHSRKVVGWYKYKVASSFNFTFREKIVHKQLVNLFDVPPEFFTCCLLISESSDNGSTHSFTQNFVRYHNDSYDQLPLHIVNLSDANNTYKSPENASETFQTVLEGLNINHKTSQGLTIITKIENALEKYTSDVVIELSEVEKRLFQFENEIKEIQLEKAKQFISASDQVSVQNHNSKESHLNDVIMMDIDSSKENEVNPTDNAKSVPRRSARVQGKSTSKTGNRLSQSPTKKNNQKLREITTRSKKLH